MLVTISLAYAQGEQNGIEMADIMRSEGKIYVVVLVVVILFTGLVLYAFNTDRKLQKVEKEIESLKSDKNS
jgi:CcmD family protein